MRKGAELLLRAFSIETFLFDGQIVGRPLGSDALAVDDVELELLGILGDSHIDAGLLDDRRLRAVKAIAHADDAGGVLTGQGEVAPAGTVL